jgi:hypothetical protein
MIYAIRDSAITRWWKAMNRFTLEVLAGHTHIKTTRRYCHPCDECVRKAFEQAS